jgi:hypothetical protein
MCHWLVAEIDTMQCADVLHCNNGMRLLQPLMNTQTVTNWTMQHPSETPICSQLVYLTHLCLGLQCSHIHSGLPTTTPNAFVVSCMPHVLPISSLYYRQWVTTKLHTFCTAVCLTTGHSSSATHFHKHGTYSDITPVYQVMVTFNWSCKSNSKPF